MAFKEIKVQEEVACNLVPMIDIMFLLLLFFMLNADMSQRELEEISPPKAEQAMEDKAEDNVDRVTVNVHHLTITESFTCSLYEESAKRDSEQFGAVCRDETHWRISVSGQAYSLDPSPALADGLVELQKKLSYLADSKRAVAGDKTSPSERFVIIRADKSAPYGFIQRAVERLAAAGLYKLEVAAFIPKAEINKR